MTQAQPRTERPLRAQARGVDRLLPLAWAVTLALFVAGCALPAISIEAWFIQTEEVSVTRAVLSLFREGHLGLALVIAIFAGLVPLAKMAALAVLWRHPRPAARGFGRALELTGRLGKWAMLDVFVLALVVFAVQSQGLASALVLPGAYCFAGAALLSMVVTYRLQALARPAGDSAAGEVTGP
ncbi:paraquat-inducible protein A [Marinibaculum pumilum]|uniref:Paraquat-inducible protein A n=1 Tax=Marinibaculum pumilum TaxID=1766165 RepID=A0ABV7L9M7_9PROT